MNISLSPHIRIVGKDEILFRQGEEAAKLFLVKSGGVLGVTQTKDRLVPVFHAGAQQVVGEDAVLAAAPHSFSAIVTEEAEIVEINAADVRGLIKDAPHWIGQLFSTLAERFGETTEAVVEHRIFNPSLSGGRELPPEEETRLKKLLAGAAPQ